MYKVYECIHFHFPISYNAPPTFIVVELKKKNVKTKTKFRHQRDCPGICTYHHASWADGR